MTITSFSRGLAKEARKTKRSCTQKRCVWVDENYRLQDIQLSAFAGLASVGGTSPGLGRLFREPTFFTKIVWDDSTSAPAGATVGQPRMAAPRSSRERAKAETPGSKFAGGHRSRVTPVPIPNTEVKPTTADGTARETVWESRSLPALSQRPERVITFGPFLFLVDSGRYGLSAPHTGYCGLRVLPLRPCSLGPRRVSRSPHWRH